VRVYGRNPQGLILGKFIVAFDEKVFRELDKDAKSLKHKSASISQSGSNSRMDPKRKQIIGRNSDDA
jgi:hypothetical protein